MYLIDTEVFGEPAENYLRNATSEKQEPTVHLSIRLCSRVSLFNTRNDPVTQAFLLSDTISNF